MVPTIKERLLKRFFKAKGIVGDGWKSALLKSDDYFDSKEGQDCIHSVSRAINDPRLANVDRIEKVTIALERIANIKSIPVC